MSQELQNKKLMGNCKPGGTPARSGHTLMRSLNKASVREERAENQPEETRLQIRADS